MPLAPFQNLGFAPPPQHNQSVWLEMSGVGFNLYIVMCQRGRVSIKPADLQAAMRHGPLTL